MDPSKIDLDRLAVETLAEKARTEWIWVDGVFLPEDYKRVADAVENFDVRDDDVWICSFQKSGTTWTQEMVWGITHADDTNFESAKEPINARFPFLEFSGTITSARVYFREPKSDVPQWLSNSTDYCKNMPSPRHIKCHLPFNLLPRQIRTGEKKPKIVYVARNPKDICISFYHHSQLLEGYCGTFEQFCELFLGDRVNYAPYWNHVIGFWEKKSRDNVLFLKFEDMKADLTSVVKKTASFLGEKLSDEKIQTLVDHLSFAKMKKNPALNRVKTVEYIRNMKVFGDNTPDGEFIRNGNVGQWKTTMSEKMIQRFDTWIEDNLKNNQDLIL